MASGRARARNRSMKSVSGLEQLHRAFDAVLVDAWGVLHDGAKLYPAARRCLLELAKNGIPVVVVSNAARRVPPLRRELEDIGLDAGLYLDVISSGELTWRALSAGIIPAPVGGTGFYLGPPRSRPICDGLDYCWTDNPVEADFVLNTGAPSGNPDTTGSLKPLIEEMLELRLPMICANPDRVAVRSGVLGISAGAIARHYRELGGQVTYYGKPDAEIFTCALSLLPGIDKSRTLMVGDAFETDIAGANRAGLASLLIAGGIHAVDLNPLNETSVARLASRFDAVPDYFCDLFGWRGRA